MKVVQFQNRNLRIDRFLYGTLVIGSCLDLILPRDLWTLELKQDSKNCLEKAAQALKDWKEFLGKIKIWQDLAGFYRILQDLTGFNWIQQDLTGFDRIWKDSTGFGRIRHNFKGFKRILNINSNFTETADTTTTTEKKWDLEGWPCRRSLKNVSA